MKRVECYYEDDFGDEYPASYRYSEEGDFYIADEADSESAAMVSRLIKEGISPTGYRLQPLSEIGELSNALERLHQCEISLKIKTEEHDRCSEDYIALRHATNALLHQIDIGTFVDDNGHDARMLKPVHDLMRMLADSAEGNREAN